MISEAFGPSARVSLPTDDDFTYAQSVLDAARGVKPNDTRSVGCINFGPMTPTGVTAIAAPIGPNDYITLGKPDHPAKDQVGGSHYKNMAIDVFTFTMANKLDPLQHSVIKYVTRFRAKNGLTDLLKARDCLNRLIAHDYPDHKDTK